MKLYSYWRSSTSYRVRIALNLKGLSYTQQPVNLLKGEQHDEVYAALNPSKSLPLLEVEGQRLTQSLAIMEYLEEVFPRPALLPKDATARAHVRAMTDVVACDVHPVNNLRILKYLKDILHVSDEEKMAWMHHWFAEGFAALEAMLNASDDVGQCCYGDEPTFADIALVSQLYNARRFGADLTPYPTINRIDAHCQTLSAFEQAKPENQPDAVID